MIPVVRLVIPGLEWDPHHPNYRPGYRAREHSGRPMRAVIFAGPSLPPQRGPLARSISTGARRSARASFIGRRSTRPAVIGIIDGYFEVTPTVWHKEILWAMAQGVHVFGAASIGALRAAELDVFGMKGIGRIYEDFRDGVLDDDDEVAVLHGPAELGYPPLTEAMVNIRATLRAAEGEGIVSAGLGAKLTGIAKSLFYKERNYEAMLQSASAFGLDVGELSRFTDWLPQGRVDQKRLDATAIFDAILAHLVAAPPPLFVSYELADTVAWRAARQRIGATVG